MHPFSVPLILIRVTALPEPIPADWARGGVHPEQRKFGVAEQQVIAAVPQQTRKAVEIRLKGYIVSMQRAKEQFEVEEVGEQTDPPDDNQQEENYVGANRSPRQTGSEPVDAGPQSQDDATGAEGDPAATRHAGHSSTSQGGSPIHFSNSSEETEPPTEDEEELTVLDAEHPLVAKKQAALKNQLTKELERLTLDLREEVATEKAEASQTEEIYVQLFREQERLKRLQTRLDDQQQNKVLAEGKHREVNDELEAVKSFQSCTTSQCETTRANVSNLQMEVDKLQSHLRFTQEVSENLRSNVKAMKNVTRRTAAKKSQAEDQKLTQDIYVERLTKCLERLTQQKELYGVQTKAQAETTWATKEALSEAEIQMVSLAMSQKKLLQQWNRSLVDLRRRDEDFTALQEAISMAEHQIIVLDREIEGMKKSIAELQEESETLTMLLNCTHLDCEVSKKMISQKQTQHENLQAQYSTYLRALGQTERTLAELTKEDSVLQAEVTDRRRQLEKNKDKHLELENGIMNQMLQKLMDNKAAQYYQRLTNKKASLKKEKVYQLWLLESEVMAATVESNVINEKLQNLARTQKELDGEITKYNKVVASNQAESSSIDALITQKQAAIVNYNKKKDLITARTGHEDLSPLQVKVEAMKTQTEELSEKIKNDQQLWLKHQGDLVGLTLQVQAHNSEYNKLQAKYTVICQKKIYLERQLEVMRREENEVEKRNKMLERDLLKLNTFLSKNVQLRQALEQENAAMESDFLHKLKEAERVSVEMEVKLEKTQAEKEKLLSSLVEAERQIMLWEKKSHLMKETRLIVEEGHGDLQIMKDDIHRMERQLNQLMKHREQLVRKSVAGVERRGNIIERHDAMARSTKKQITKGELDLVNNGLRRKVKETQKMVKEWDQEIKELQESRVNLSNIVKLQKQQLMDLSGTSGVLETDLDKIQDTKGRDQAHLMEFQNKAKKLQEVADGTYRPSSSSSQSVEAATHSQMERVRAIRTVIHRVCEEFPDHRAALSVVLQSLAAGAHGPEQEANV
ncbi:coiled-coil domain-containing protein 40-like isoform X2 [Syngnathoides biaculeatus]|uniref:coiled-coil domain-containing protein 40-like isoform X2 n=1 Tax=Syngnathoides biaculeatus TaxID=300417 RepID=UPI002ADE38D0|nr:coiled-coil domain-containing protein 40-like isoform X2 [Syngnathoides biaculeatus]